MGRSSRSSSRSRCPSRTKANGPARRIRQRDHPRGRVGPGGCHRPQGRRQRQLADHLGRRRQPVHRLRRRPGLRAQRSDKKLSLGFARIVGGPEDFEGVNIRSKTGEAGGGRQGRAPRPAACSAWTASSTCWCETSAIRSWPGRTITPSRGTGATGNSRRASAPDVPELRQELRRRARRLRLRLLARWRQRLHAGRPHGPGPCPAGPDPRATGLRVLPGSGCEPASLSGPETSASAARSSSIPARCYRSGISYNAGLKRYLWCQILPVQHGQRGPRFQGGFGIYEAPEPWGPWHTVFYTENWDVGPGETSSFPTKWMSPDGRTCHLVFSGDDCFSVRRAELKAMTDPLPNETRGIVAGSEPPWPSPVVSHADRLL